MIVNFCNKIIRIHVYLPSLTDLLRRTLARHKESSLLYVQKGFEFQGIFFKNMRFGPGIERVLPLHSNVGFWYGNKLVRLSWVPAAPSILPDFCTGPAGPEFVEPFRKILNKKTKIVSLSWLLRIIMQ